MMLFLNNIVDGDHALVDRAKDIENSSMHHDYAVASNMVRDPHMPQAIQKDLHC